MKRLDSKKNLIPKKQKTLLMLGAGPDQAIAIRLAKEMGMRVIATDGNKDAVGLAEADVGIHVDIRDEKKLIEIGKKYKVDGVFCHAVEIPIVVAKIAAALKLPGITPAVAERATNKIKRIQCFKKHGVPCPKFEIAKSIKEAEKKAVKIGFPLVMKPIDNAGARGVRKVRTLAEVGPAFDYALKFTHHKVVLLEEYLTGPEISTESVVYKGKIYTPCFADRNYSKKDTYYPQMIEDGGDLPTSLSPKEKAAVVRVCEKAIRAIGINMGAAKGDIIIHNGKPHVFEMASRTSGGRFCDTKVPMSNGVNILKPLLAMAVGDPVDVNDFKEKYEKGVCERTIMPTPGKIIEIHGVDEAKRLDGVMTVYLNPDVVVGGAIKPLENHACKAGYVTTEAPTREEAIAAAEKAVALIQIVTQPEQGSTGKMSSDKKKVR